MRFLFVAIFILNASCARSLREDESTGNFGPQDFNQNIESVSQDQLNQIVVQDLPAVDPTVNISSPAAVPKQDQTPAPPPNDAIEPLPLFKSPIQTPAQAFKPEKKTKKGATVPPPVVAPEVATWQPQTWPFGIGEKITMVLRYGPIEAGEAELEVREPQVINGETVLHYSARVRSTKLMELVYKVNDVMHTWTGLEDHLPRRQEIHQNESKRFGKRVVVFKHQEHIARYFSFTTFEDGREETITREDKMYDFSQDVFGGLYFYRFVPDLKSLNFPIHDRFRNWANQLTYLGPETVRVPAGEFATHKFQMSPRVSGDLAPKGDVTIWIWDHPSKVMVQFAAKIRVGSVFGELKKYEPGRPMAVSPPKMKTTWNLPTNSVQ